MDAQTVASAEQKTGLRTAILCFSPLTALFVAWLGTAFWQDGWAGEGWLPWAIFLALVGLAVSALIIYPRRPRQLSLLVLGVFTLYTLWVAASALWAASPTRVGLETVRLWYLLLAFVLAQVYLTHPTGRRQFRYLLMAAALVLLAGCIWRLWSAAEVGRLFQAGRFTFPTGYPNGSAALFLVAFWPLMWLAAAPAERVPIRGVALGLATGLVATAVLTQSRGALYSLIISLLIVFAISPIRLRLLLYLIVPGLLLTYAFPFLNRYWLENPDAVGGGVAARTLLVATLAAAFMGLIVSLLERWIPASRRMKAIFGTVVLLGALVAVVYGAIVLTQDQGGPGRWLADSWNRFLAKEEPEIVPGTGSRLTSVGSSGAIDLWETAWQVFKEHPAEGVGADNFGFSYDRLGSNGASGPADAHSLPLQVLAESGAVGGSLLGLGVLLSLGGLLWGRSAAAWRHARRGWLRLPGRAPLGVEGAEAGRTRWGEDAAAYGWEMALLGGLAYWFIHAAFDRLWQMSALAFPALLLLAAGLAAVDGRVEVLWPRLHNRLRLRARTEPERTGPDDEGRVHSGSLGVGPTHDGTLTEGWPDDPALLGGSPEVRRLEAEEPITNDGPLCEAADGTVPRRRRNVDSPSGGVFGVRRSDQYLSKWKRRQRRAERRQRSAQRLQPPGVLSAALRAALLVLSILVLVGAALPCTSLLLQESARSLAQNDGLAAARRAQLAAWFRPGDPGPFATKGSIYMAAATARPPGGTAAVLDDLALALAALERSAQKEPAAWSWHYRAGVTALNMAIVAAGPQHTDSDASQDPHDGRGILAPSVQDWSWLAEEQTPPTITGRPGGRLSGSLWPSYGVPENAHLYRTMTSAQLSRVALIFLLEAQLRNPKAPEISAALDLARRLAD